MLSSLTNVLHRGIRSQRRLHPQLTSPPRLIVSSTPFSASSVFSPSSAIINPSHRTQQLFLSTLLTRHTLLSATFLCPNTAPHPSIALLILLVLAVPSFLFSPCLNLFALPFPDAAPPCEHRVTEWNKAAAILPSPAAAAWQRRCRKAAVWWLSDDWRVYGGDRFYRQTWVVWCFGFSGENPFGSLCLLILVSVL
ncbi:hypothetical protein Droror1_Dr00012034 [Drosera rotundifolia]